jgi:hypothetical protein
MPVVLSPTAARIVTLLERIRDLAGDLAHEVAQGHGHADGARDIAEAIRTDIDAVLQGLSTLKH